MKAKEIANRVELKIKQDIELNGKQGDDAIVEHLGQALFEILGEIKTKLGVVSRDEGKVAVWREGFKKWQAVCDSLRKVRDSKLITPLMFNIMLTEINPELYVALMEKGVFYSQKLSASEQEHYNGLKRAVFAKWNEQARSEEHKKQMQAFANLFFGRPVRI